MQLNRHSLNPFPVNAFGNADIRTIICHFDFQKLHRSSMSNYMVSYIEKKLQKPWLNQKTDRALCYGTDVRLCKQQIKDILFLKMFNQLINFLLLMTEMTQPHLNLRIIMQYIIDLNLKFKKLPHALKKLIYNKPHLVADYICIPESHLGCDLALVKN